MSYKYILDGRKAVPIEDVILWANWFDSADRHVAQNIIKGVKISTVFLGLDHSFGDGEPLLFETMVFGGELDQDMDRYSTWDKAEEGHKKMVERVKKFDDEN